MATPSYNTDNDTTVTFQTIQFNQNPLQNKLNFLETENQTVSLLKEISRLEQSYYEICNFLTTPAVLHYDELARLRRQASNPAISMQWRAQLRLAVELLRLGRREESFWVLHTVERRMAISNEQLLVYRLWLATIKAAGGDYNGAINTAQNVIMLLDDYKGRQVMSFFHRISQMAFGLNARNKLFAELADESDMHNQNVLF